MNRLKLKLAMMSVCIFSLFFYCDFENPKKVQIDRDDYYPNFSFHAIDIPEHLEQSPDSMAQNLTKILKSHNAMKNYTDMLLIPLEDMKNKHPWKKGWVRNWTNNHGVDVTLLIRLREEDNIYEWTLKYSGMDSINNTNYENYVIVSAEMNYEGNRIVTYVYDPALSSYHIFHAMTIVSRYACHYQFYVRESEYDVTSYSILINKSQYEEYNGVVNGFGLIYSNLVELKKISYYWDFDGAGTWTIEDISSGEIVTSGSW